MWKSGSSAPRPPATSKNHGGADASSAQRPGSIGPQFFCSKAVILRRALFARRRTPALPAPAQPPQGVLPTPPVRAPTSKNHGGADASSAQRPGSIGPQFFCSKAVILRRALFARRRTPALPAPAQPPQGALPTPPVRAPTSKNHGGADASSAQRPGSIGPQFFVLRLSSCGGRCLPAAGPLHSQPPPNRRREFSRRPPSVPPPARTMEGRTPRPPSGPEVSGRSFFVLRLSSCGGRCLPAAGPLHSQPPPNRRREFSRRPPSVPPPARTMEGRTPRPPSGPEVSGRFFFVLRLSSCGGRCLPAAGPLHSPPPPNRRREFSRRPPSVPPPCHKSP